MVPQRKKNAEEQNELGDTGYTTRVRHCKIYKIA
jgi:hypothetical protein